MATAKHKFQQLVFNPANQKVFDYPDELQKLAKDAFGVAPQAIIEHSIYANICQNASPPEEIKHPEAFGEWQIRTDCVTS